MDATPRPGRLQEADICGEICYVAFKAIAEQHNFPLDFPSYAVRAATESKARGQV